MFECIWYINSRNDLVSTRNSGKHYQFKETSRLESYSIQEHQLDFNTDVLSTVQQYTGVPKLGLAPLQVDSGY